MTEKEKTLKLTDLLSPQSTYKQLQEAVSALAPSDIKRDLGNNAVELLITGMAEAATIIGPDPNNEHCWFSLRFFHDIISWSETPVNIGTVETMSIFYVDIGYLEIDKKDNLRIINPDLANHIIKIASGQSL